MDGDLLGEDYEQLIAEGLELDMNDNMDDVLDSRESLIQTRDQLLIRCLECMTFQDISKEVRGLAAQAETLSFTGPTPLARLEGVLSRYAEVSEAADIAQENVEAIRQNSTTVADAERRVELAFNELRTTVFELLGDGVDAEQKERIAALIDRIETSEREACDLECRFRILSSHAQGKSSAQLELDRGQLVIEARQLQQKEEKYSAELATQIERGVQHSVQLSHYVQRLNSMRQTVSQLRDRLSQLEDDAAQKRAATVAAKKRRDSVSKESEPEQVQASAAVRADYATRQQEIERLRTRLEELREQAASLQEKLGESASRMGTRP